MRKMRSNKLKFKKNSNGKKNDENAIGYYTYTILDTMIRPHTFLVDL